MRLVGMGQAIRQTVDYKRRLLEWLLASSLLPVPSLGLAQTAAVSDTKGAVLAAQAISPPSPKQAACGPEERLPAAVKQKIDLLQKGQADYYSLIIDMLNQEKIQRDCPVFDCSLAIYYDHRARYAEMVFPKDVVEKMDLKAYEEAKRCRERHGDNPGNIAQADGLEIDRILKTGESRWGAKAQPSYRRDVNIAIALSVVGAAFLGAGFATYGVLQDHPLATGASSCTSSFGLANEPCGTRLHSVTVPLMAVGVVALGGAAAAAVRLLKYPETYLPK